MITFGACFVFFFKGLYVKTSGLKSIDLEILGILGGDGNSLPPEVIMLVPTSSILTLYYDIQIVLRHSTVWFSFDANVAARVCGTNSMQNQSICAIELRGLW